MSKTNKKQLYGKNILKMYGPRVKPILDELLEKKANEAQDKNKDAS